MASYFKIARDKLFPIESDAYRSNRQPTRREQKMIGAYFVTSAILTCASIAIAAKISMPLLFIAAAAAMSVAVRTVGAKLMPYAQPFQVYDKPEDISDPKYKELFIYAQETLGKAGFDTPLLMLVNQQIRNGKKNFNGAIYPSKVGGKTILILGDGLFEILTADEVKGIIDHEVGHKLQGFFVTNFMAGSGMVRGINAGGLALVAWGTPAFTVALGIALVGKITKAGIERIREYQADRYATTFGGDIDRQISSFVKARKRLIDAVRKTSSNRTNRSAAPAGNGFRISFFVREVFKLFSSHPDIRARISRLLQIRNNMVRPANTAQVQPRPI